MAQEKIYSIHNNRISRGVMTGFMPDGNTVATDEKEAMHMILLQPFDGVDEDARWQRFAMHMELAEDVMCTVYVRASNDRKISHDTAFREPETTGCGKDIWKKQNLKHIRVKKISFCMSIREGICGCVLNLWEWEHPEYQI